MGFALGIDETLNVIGRHAITDSEQLFRDIFKQKTLEIMSSLKDCRLSLTILGEDQLYVAIKILALSLRHITHLDFELE